MPLASHHLRPPTWHHRTMSERHPAHRPTEGMVWIAASGHSLLQGIEAACKKFDRWGIRGEGERVLFCSADAFETVCSDLQHRRRIVGRFKRATDRDARDALAENCGITRVVITSLFDQPLVRCESGHPTPAAEATIMEPTR